MAARKEMPMVIRMLRRTGPRTAEETLVVRIPGPMPTVVYQTKTVDLTALAMDRAIREMAEAMAVILMQEWMGLKATTEALGQTLVEMLTPTATLMRTVMRTLMRTLMRT
jgi:hypothetical protein